MLLSAFNEYDCRGKIVSDVSSTEDIDEPFKLPEIPKEMRYYLVVPSLLFHNKLHGAVIDITESDYRVAQDPQHSMSTKYSLNDVWLYMANRHKIYCTIMPVCVSLDKPEEKIKNHNSLYEKKYNEWNIIRINVENIRSNDYADGELLHEYLNGMSGCIGKHLYVEMAPMPCKIPGAMYGQGPFALWLMEGAANEVLEKQRKILITVNIEKDRMLKKLGEAISEKKYDKMDIAELWDEYCNYLSIMMRVAVVKLYPDQNIVIVRGEKDWYRMMNYH